MHWPGFELAIFRSRVRRPTTTLPTTRLPTATVQIRRHVEDRSICLVPETAKCHESADCSELAKPREVKGQKVHYSSPRETHLRATGRHLPYGITQCYLPPDTSERTPP